MWGRYFVYCKHDLLLRNTECLPLRLSSRCKTVMCSRREEESTSKQHQFTASTQGLYCRAFTVLCIRFVWHGLCLVQESRLFSPATGDTAVLKLCALVVRTGKPDVNSPAPLVPTAHLAPSSYDCWARNCQTTSTKPPPGPKHTAAVQMHNWCNGRKQFGCTLHFWVIITARYNWSGVWRSHDGFLNPGPPLPSFTCTK